MYGEENERYERNEGNGSEERGAEFGRYASPENGDGYIRPDFGTVHIGEKKTDPADGERSNSGLKTEEGHGEATSKGDSVAGTRDGSEVRYGGAGYVNNGNGYSGNPYANNGNAYGADGYSNNGYGGNGYGGSRGYYGNGADRYGSPDTRGNYQQNRQYSYSQPINPRPRRMWVLPLAVVLCLAMCLGCFFAGLSMVRDNGIDNGGSQGENNGGNVNNGGSGGNSGSESEKSPFLTNGELELEQLPADSVYYTIPSVVSATQNTVVEITTETMTTGSYWGQYVTTGAGSGVIIKSYSQKGDSGACGTYIITNNHVIEGAYSIKAKLTNGAEYEAVLVAADPQTDMAVIHIDEINLPAAKLGRSDQLVAGQTVVVIGNPLGSLGGSVSSGIISCTERNIEIDNNVMKLIQTTAAVNPGNSGGAMFDLEGKLVGVVNAKYSDEQIEGIGFAIPIDIAYAVAKDLIDYGYVKGRPNHGITAIYGYCNYRNIKIYYDNTYIQGVWASQVAENSDAARAGLKAYDQIVSVVGTDGRAYSFSSAAEVTAFLDALKVGDIITVNAYRYTPKDSFMGTSFDRAELSFTFTVTEYEE